MKTGQRDRKGREILVDDVVRVHAGTIARVMVDMTGEGFFLAAEMGTIVIPSWSQLEVLGNYGTNPELLPPPKTN